MAGALRIHFSDRDFRYVQLARTADPMWEAFLGLHVLNTPPGCLPARLHPWRRRAAQRLRQGELRTTCRMLLDLAPVDASYFPDFLTPAESEEGLTEAVRALRATPASRLARELREAARHRPLPAWTRRLAAGDRALLDRVADAVLRFHTEVIAPDWSEIEAFVAAGREERDAALDGGVVGVLATLVPFVWRDPVLSAPYPVDAELHLRGRGVRLVPSYFCYNVPIAIADPNLPPVVVYPAAGHERLGGRERTFAGDEAHGHGRALVGGRPSGARSGASDGSGVRHAGALAALLGAGRCRVLGALTVTHTTGAVAARLGMPASTVSGHLKVLRDAGLVASERKGTHVLHRLTGRGRHLLDGHLPDG
ncbi:ArsR/SmtB family transcription factor [Streptomyces cavernicola]|uniref:Helix-turn-helix domain-containing protein n=1 Tax=Streptomyces cavernicola TaxID=3043613 RepID=A0ABT6S6Y3_9ACTN|nr:helix-turn-helix domain-containing protein [Streptomyces sp. B-S-A6]MDI3403644.1 helix-turn-helix domain-containing protein [Streptomyces sp. B-S-A6]